MTQERALNCDRNISGRVLPDGAHDIHTIIQGALYLEMQLDARAYGGGVDWDSHPKGL